MAKRTSLSIEEIEAALADLPDWRFENDRLAKRFQFSSFREAMSFMVRLSFEAEMLNHHPELTNVYGRVDVVLTTHDAGNRVTAKDIALAQSIEQFSWI